eukprot:gnl/Spiro4/22982_TR11348_c0_g1_i1.p2 gnl/Spiro4/22982_TR11348_c0_g1~~gnl/Spiro4/22982_TR11348_c0_g1_i1.p2  ORF type:complete len:310 (-),score=75.41 gnl/Spiro4/22982_TR11348_c0_g1_i1:134-1024(-)
MAFAGAEGSVPQLLEALNESLLTKTFLVGESCSYADVTLAGTLKFVFDQNAARPGVFVNVDRWYNTVINNSLYKAAEALCKPKDGKKEGGKTQAAKAPAAKAPAAKAAPAAKPAAAAPTPAPAPAPAPAKAPAAAEEEEEFVWPADKFNMEDWKRTYQNARDYRAVCAELWRRLDLVTDKSVYLADYKFPEEVTQGFLGCNKVTGLYQRLDAARKYTFGVMSILQNSAAGNFPIQGVWVFTTNDIPPSFSDVDDTEVYTMRKIDWHNPTDRALVEEHLQGVGSFGGCTLVDSKTFC